MSNAIKVSVSVDGILKMREKVRKYRQRLDERMSKAMRAIAVKWAAEAKRRCPVDTGRLRNSIVYEHGYSGVSEYFARVGTNVKYAKYVEFGTTQIAGGRVKALGTGQEIPESRAITIWPAKNAGLVNEKDGTANKAWQRLEAKKAAGGTQEMMPWLRTSFWVIKDWSKDLMRRAAKF